MCHYITGTIKAGTKIEAVNELSKLHGLSFERIENKYVQDQLPKGTSYIWKRSAHCDCGTVLGCLSFRPHGTEQPFSLKEVEALKKKGWSTAKIERWIEDKRKKQHKLLQANEHYRKAVRPNAEEWTSFLRGVVTHAAIGQFGLILHFYKTGPEEEKISLKGQQTVPIDTVSPEFLMGIEEDILYTFA